MKAIKEKLSTQPRINHKVEQIVRAVLIGFSPDAPSTLLNVSCFAVPLICQYNPDEHVVIGLADERGYRFAPECNSALITLGIHPTAFLYHLTKTRNADGVPCVRETTTQYLTIEFGALVQCARDAVFNWETKEHYNGKLQRRKPILEAYILNGKPASFA